MNYFSLQHVPTTPPAKPTPAPTHQVDETPKTPPTPAETPSREPPKPTIDIDDLDAELELDLENVKLDDNIDTSVSVGHIGQDWTYLH